MTITVNGVAVPAQSKTLDTTTVTTGFGLVHRQIIGIADPENQSQYARLTGTSLNVNVTNTAVAISATSLPLPTDASTSALQTTGNNSLSSIDSKITAVNTGAVVVSSSVLPTDASTSALQTTGNSSLSSIDTKTPALVTGRIPVDGSAVTQPVSAVSLPLPAGAATEATLLSIDGKIAGFGTAGTPSADVISVQGISGGEPLSVDVVQPVVLQLAPSSYLHRNANGTTTVKSGAGVLRRIVINTKGGITNTLTIYDNTTATGAVIGVVDTGNTAGGAFDYELDFTTGLTVVLAGGIAADITIIYE